jgi:two-component system, cell cycle sensor histidine kinase and response regulator CckA
MTDSSRTKQQLSEENCILLRRIRELEQSESELRQAKDALKESERKYRELVENANSIILRFNRNGIITFLNEFGQKFFGYSEKEIIGRHVVGSIVPEIESTGRDLKPLLDKICLNPDAFEQNINENIRRNGERVWISWTNRIAMDRRGQILEVLSIGSDITERRRLEDQLRHTQKIESLGRLAGGIAHDFNNILNAIIGFTDLLKMKIVDNEPAMRYAEQILKAGQRGAALTRQVLAFSRKQMLDMRPVNINDNIRDLQKMLCRLVREDILIRLELSDQDLIVMADADQLDQVIINLTTNARDAMPGGGSIDISTCIFTMDEGFVRSYGFGNPGIYALITLSDTGCGMDYETLLRIFEPFFTTKEKDKGTGLGLAAVYGILNQHGGYINVESGPGKGTVFYLYLPLNPEIAAKTELTPTEELRGGTETILIAEDDDTTRNITVTALTGFGYKVIEASDGEDAINKFIENSDVVDLLILDYIMPKKNGMEVFDAIRKHLPGIKAIFVSGYTDGSFDNNYLSRKNASFVQKPVKPTDLVRTVRETLDAE